MALGLPLGAQRALEKPRLAISFSAANRSESNRATILNCRNRKILVVLYGSKYWKEIINFEALVRHGTIDAEDLKLFQFADDPDGALRIFNEFARSQ